MLALKENLKTFLFHCKHFPLMLLNELYLMGLMYWHYKWSYFINALTTAGDFIWWMLLIDGGTLVPHKIAPAFVGYVVWIYANYVIYDSNTFITEAGQTGVLEQIYLSPYPLAINLLGRFCAGIAYCSLELTLVIATLFILSPITLTFSLGGLLAFFITLVGIAGFALILAGVGLVFKKSQPFAYLLNNLLLFFNGSILPLSTMPLWIQTISKTLPTTQGIEVLRAFSFNNQSLAYSIADGSMIMLILNSTAYLTIGLVVFLYCERWAQRTGSLGSY